MKGQNNFFDVLAPGQFNGAVGQDPDQTTSRASPAHFIYKATCFHFYLNRFFSLYKHTQWQYPLMSSFSHILPSLSQGLREQIAVRGQMERQRRYGSAVGGSVSSDTASVTTTATRPGLTRKSSTMSHVAAKANRENWLANCSAEDRDRLIVRGPGTNFTPIRTLSQHPGTLPVRPSLPQSVRPPARSSSIPTTSAFSMPTTTTPISDYPPLPATPTHSEGSTLVRRPSLPSSPACTKGVCSPVNTHKPLPLPDLDTITEDCSSPTTVEYPSVNAAHYYRTRQPHPVTTPF